MPGSREKIETVNRHFTIRLITYSSSSENVNSLRIAMKNNPPSPPRYRSFPARMVQPLASNPCLARGDICPESHSVPLARGLKTGMLCERRHPLGPRHVVHRRRQHQRALLVSCHHRPRRRHGRDRLLLFMILRQHPDGGREKPGLRLGLDTAHQRHHVPTSLHPPEAAQILDHCDLQTQGYGGVVQ